MPAAELTEFLNSISMSKLQPVAVPEWCRL